MVSGHNWLKCTIVTFSIRFRDSLKHFVHYYPFSKYDGSIGK